jgi:hypothetical protein
MNNMLSLNMVGCDPEIFWTKNGKPFSVEGLIGGTKKDPRPIPKAPFDGFAVQEDNVAAEFNTPPAATSIEFSKSVGFAVKFIERLAKKHGCKLAFVPDLDFSDEQVSTPHAMLMGCEPDYSVWTMQVNPRPIAPHNMRTAAGHVHISWVGGIADRDTQRDVGRISDVYLGCAQVATTEPNRRRQLYGKAGCIRPKPWGIEYRTLDNQWVGHPSQRVQVFDNIKLMFNAIQTNPGLINEVNNWGDEIQQAINEHDRDMAFRILSMFNVPPLPYVAPLH